MKEVFLSKEVSLAHYNVNMESSDFKDMALETRNGREYLRWSYEKTLEGIGRAVRIIQAIALTVFSFFFGLLSADVRLLWSEGLRGREVVVVFNPLLKLADGCENHSEEPAGLTERVVPAAPAMAKNELTMFEWMNRAAPQSKLSIVDEECEHYVFGTPAEGEEISSPDIMEWAPSSQRAFEIYDEDNPPEMALKAKRQEILQALTATPDNPPFDSIVSFIEDSIALYGDEPYWSNFADSWHAGGTSMNKERLLSFFYDAVSIMKDFKAATDVERVRAKILAPIELDHAKTVGTHSIATGPVNRKSEIIDPTLKAAISLAPGNSSMHAYHIAEKLWIFGAEGWVDIPCLALFDGYGSGGWDCSLYLKLTLAELIGEELQRHPLLDDLNISNALKRAFARANLRFKNNYLSEKGSTAVVALVIKGALWIANTGDSRAVLSDGSVARQLSEDAKPGKDVFKKGIVSRGGSVIFDKVNGNVATARAFGQGKERGMTARPRICKADISSGQEKPRYLILGSKGLFDVVTSEEAVNFIQDFSDPSLAADQLLELAFERRTTSSVAVMVAKLGT